MVTRGIIAAEAFHSYGFEREHSFCPREARSLNSPGCLPDSTVRLNTYQMSSLERQASCGEQTTWGLYLNKCEFFFSILRGLRNKSGVHFFGSRFSRNVRENSCLMLKIVSGTPFLSNQLCGWPKTRVLLCAVAFCMVQRLLIDTFFDAFVVSLGTRAY